MPFCNLQSCSCFNLDEATSLLKKLFEGHSSKEPSELLVKAGAEGDLKQIDELYKTGAAKVSLISFYYQRHFRY